MPKVRTMQSALNGGELSPLMLGRTDLPRYQHGLELCRNAIPQVLGGVIRTWGTRYIANAAAAQFRLISFPVIRSGQMYGYTLEFSNLALRFFLNGQQVMSGNAPYQLATTYTAAELAALEYDTSASVLYLFHPDHCPRRLTRKTSDTDWVLEDLPITDWPFMRPIGTEGISMSPSATSGDVTLTTDKDLFVSGHVGCRISINGGICTITSVTNPRTAQATVSGTITTNDHAVSGTDVLHLHYSITPSVDLHGDPVPISWSIDLTETADFTNQTLESNYPNPGELPNGLTITRTHTMNKLNGIGVDADWKEQAWSDRLGWPSCGGFFEQRLLLGASATYPTYVWGSHSGKPLVWTIGTLDSDAFAFNLSAAATALRHLVSANIVGIFTGDCELTLNGSSDAPLTPSNVQVKNRTPHGSGLIRPVRIGGEMYFSTTSGCKLRAFSYQYTSDSYIAGDVAFIAEHLVSGNGGIKEMAFAREPHSLLWVVCNNGALLSFTIDKENEVAAWAMHGDDAIQYRTVCVARGSDGIDQVYFGGSYLLGGDTRNFVCCLDSATNTNAAKTYTGPIQILTGLEHLEGADVDIKADGYYYGRYTVRNGSVTLPQIVDSAEAGLPYVTTIKDLPTELANPGQSIQGSSIAVSKIRVRLFEAQGCTVNGERIPFRSFTDIMTPPPPYTGDKEVRQLGRSNDPEDTQVAVIQELPFPLTMLAIIKEVNING